MNVARDYLTQALSELKRRYDDQRARWDELTDDQKDGWLGTAVSQKMDLLDVAVSNVEDALELLDDIAQITED